jgi:hypothetical protein
MSTNPLEKTDNPEEERPSPTPTPSVDVAPAATEAAVADREEVNSNLDVVPNGSVRLLN